MPLIWSDPIPFDQNALRGQVPRSPGVYQIVQTPAYQRYEGSTAVLKIGKSDGSLQDEVLNHFQRHTAANRLARIRGRPGASVSVVYSVLAVGDVAEAERTLLREFEDRHWDLPVLNSQRGYARATDAHYRGS